MDADTIKAIGEYVIAPICFVLVLYILLRS